MKRVPFVLGSAAPLSWPGHEQIREVMGKVWEQLGAQPLLLWYPVPRIDAALIRKLKKEASVLVFPLEVRTVDALKFLSFLRDQHGIRAPAILVCAAEFLTGFEAFITAGKVLRKGDFVVTNSSYEKALLQQGIGLKSECVSIPLPVATSQKGFWGSDRRIQFKLQLGMQAKDPLIVFAGRISLEKNIHNLLKCFSVVKKKYPRAKLFLIGPIDNYRAFPLPLRYRGKYNHFLAETLCAADLEQNVVFYGGVGQKVLKSFLSACDLQISLTTNVGEDFGYSIAQGIARGAPTVLSDWGGGHDFVLAGAARGVPVFADAAGPQIDLPTAIQSAFSLLNRETNELSRKDLQVFAQKNLSFSSVTKKWRQLLNHSQEKSPRVSTPIVSMDLEYMRAHLSKVKLEKQIGRQVDFMFPSTIDPLYLRIIESYGARREELIRGVFLNPFFSLSQNVMLEPNHPLYGKGVLKLDLRKLQQLWKRRSWEDLVDARGVRNKDWLRDLVKVGVLIPTQLL